MMVQCNYKAEILRESIERGEIIYKIEYYGAYTFLQDNQMIDWLITEMIREIDAKQQENNYAREYLGSNYKKIDLEARNHCNTGVPTSIIKCITGFNQYRRRNW